MAPNSLSSCFEILLGCHSALEKWTWKNLWTGSDEGNTCSSIQSWDNVSSTDSSSGEKKTKKNIRFENSECEILILCYLFMQEIGHLVFFLTEKFLFGCGHTTTHFVLQEVRLLSMQSGPLNQ